MHQHSSVTLHELINPRTLTIMTDKITHTVCVRQISKPSYLPYTKIWWWWLRQRQCVTM